MAQLDIASFMPQVVWLVIVFGGYNLIVSKNIIPTISKLIKVRNKKMGVVGGGEISVGGYEKMMKVEGGKEEKRVEWKGGGEEKEYIKRVGEIVGKGKYMESVL